jgi:hypothetical protein
MAILTSWRVRDPGLFDAEGFRDRRPPKASTAFIDAFLLSMLTPTTRRLLAITYREVINTLSSLAQNPKLTSIMTRAASIATKG